MSTYTLGQRVLYSSTSQGGQVLTEITQVLPSGAVEVHCKPGYFMRPDEQELRIQPHGQGSATPLLAALPATPTPSQQLQQAAAAPTGRSGLTPDPKRANMGTGGLMSGTSIGTLPQHVFMTASAVPAAPPPGVGQAAPTDNAGLLNSIEGLLDRKLSGSETRLEHHFKVQIGGLEERLGHRISAVETTQAEQSNQITDLLQRVRKLEVSNRSSSVPAKRDDGRHLEAFIGGFPALSRKAIEARVQAFVGAAAGLDADKPFSAGGNVSSIAFVRFMSTEHRDAFVTGNAQRAEQIGLRFKKNRSAEDRARASTAWNIYEQLSRAGVPRDNATIARSRVFQLDGNGNATEIGKVDGEKVIWNQAAPGNLRNTE